MVGENGAQKKGPIPTLYAVAYPAVRAHIINSQLFTYSHVNKRKPLIKSRAMLRVIQLHHKQNISAHEF